MSIIKRGAFIVLEGVDRSGKSSQCKKLLESLLKLNIKAKQLNFPNRTTKTGKLIDEYLKNSKCDLNDQTIHLLFSANRWESVDTIKKELENGITLIVDRYSYSGIAYSSAKKDLNYDWCKLPENGLPKPDIVFLLSVNAEIVSKRSEFGKERYEKPEFQQKVIDVFDKLSKEDNNWCVVDASGQINEIHDKILKESLKKIEEVKTLPLTCLNFNPKL